MIGGGPAARTERLVGELESSELDCLLVTGRADLRYLTGFTGSNGLALVGPDVRLFVTDFRYVEQAATEVGAGYERVQASGPLVGGLAEHLPGRSALRLGFDDAELTVRAHNRLRDGLPAGVELRSAAGLVKGLRAVKEPAEIQAITAAARLADEALEAVLTSGITGRSERELALALEYEMRTRGAEGVAFAPIIAAGPHGARPHAEPRDVAVRAGELVVFDWGARVEGYLSDCTRTVAAGEPGAEAREVYELVRTAQATGRRAVQAGASAAEVDRQARVVIADAGYGEYFGHGLGHGVGLEAHESPSLNARSQDLLEAGNVITVEPGVYLPGRLGVRIEDLILVTEGAGELLTQLDHQLLIVS